MIKDQREKVQVWVVANDAHQTFVLLLKTIPKRGSQWHPITGWVDEGESALHAAKRELFEETKIQENPKPFSRPFSYEVSKPFYAGRVEESYFKVSLDSKQSIEIDPSEHTEFQWVELENACDYLHFDSQIHALKHLK